VSVYNLHNLQVTTACGRLKALFLSTQSDVFVNLVCTDFWILKDIFLPKSLWLRENAYRHMLSQGAHFP
jgi:hypothetical protein